MTRRKAILTALFAGGIGVSFFSLSRWYMYTHRPDLSALGQNIDLIAELAEVIIPRTETPGAKDVGVHHFIVKVVEDCLEPKNQRSFLGGLEDLKKYTQDHYGKDFIGCNVSQREEVIAYFESSTESFNVFMKKVRKKIMGDTFFSILKQYTAIGYCTSMAGATKGLSYDYIPSAFESCIPLRDGQKSWATK